MRGGRGCPHGNRTAVYHEEDLRQCAQGCCESCDAEGPNLWVCLQENCGYVGCGETASDHSSEHTKHTGHQLNLNLKSLRVWCSACEEEAFPDCIIREGTAEATHRHRVVVEREVQRVAHQHSLRNQPQNRAPTLLPVDSPVTQAKDEFFNKDAKPRGLTGLRNLGNTCYISAGIQALSNCPAFTHFFLECGSYVKTEKKPYLAKTYQKLMEEIWGKRRPSYLTPSSLINSIRSVFPMFKGFTQQDTQEFLRCFMDRLHDELKEPYIDQNNSQSSSTDEPDSTSPAAVERPRRVRSNDSLCQSDGEYSNISGSQQESSENTNLTSEENVARGRQSNAPDNQLDKNRKNKPAESGDARIHEGSAGRGHAKGTFSKENREQDASEKDIDESEVTEQCNRTEDEDLDGEEGRGASCSGQHEEKRASKASTAGKIAGSSAHEDVTLRVAETNRGKKPNLKYRSIVSDVFDGKILSSVQCLTCDTISTRKETFQDLSLPIPGKEDLARIHKSHGMLVKGATTTPCSDSYGKQGWLSWIYNWFSGWIWGPHVTLDNCLAAFFSADDLKGDNMYSCDKCKKLRNGVKFSQVLELPEVLCIHLKRFRHESMSSYSSKLNSYVSFPMDGLDMSPYLAKECNNCCYMYDLTAVICHHGTAGGGHYTCYGQNWLNGQWYEYDDMYVTEVDDLQVANCEAYVLFYKKVSDEAVKERQTVSDLFDQQESSFLHFYVSLQWVNKFNSFAEPGPISNDDFLCKHGGVPPRKASYVDQLVLKVPQPVWEYLHQRYGGGPAVNHLYACPTCQAEAEQIERRRRDEMETFIKLNEAFSQDDSSESVIYCISLAWFKTWEAFVKAKQKDPPGPIDNRPIATVKSGYTVLKHGADCGQISLEMWQYLHSIYDGGPEICLHPNRPTLLDHSTSAASEEDTTKPRDDTQSRL